MLDIEKQVTETLKKEKRDYIPVAGLGRKLPLSTLKSHGLSRSSSPSEILEKLTPFLGDSLKGFTFSGSIYVGFDLTPDEMILNKLKRRPGVSSKVLRKDIPMGKEDFIGALNRLISGGHIQCRLNADHKVFLNMGPRQDEGLKDGRAAFRAAYKKVGKGQSFVRIHRIREYLKWPSDRFDTVLTALMYGYAVQLHGGDPTALTQREIRDSFTDENGILYITMTWRGTDNESTRNA